MLAPPLSTHRTVHETRFFVHDWMICFCLSRLSSSPLPVVAAAVVSALPGVVVVVVVVAVLFVVVVVRLLWLLLRLP